jgi:thiamine pyrophosphate-dependent acetolactate synthase large subunit-like protein
VAAIRRGFTPRPANCESTAGSSRCAQTGPKSGLERAKAPVLVVGGDVERSGACSALVTLAQRVQAPVWSAPFPGLSGFPENHPLYRGVLPAGAGWISKLLDGHDLVLVFGAPAFCYYPLIPGPYLPKGTQLIHFTSDPDEAARAPVGDAVVTDVRAAAEALLGCAYQTDRPAPATLDKAQTDASPATTPLSPEKLWAKLDRVAPKNALWVSEAGGNEPIISSCIKARGPFSHLTAAALRDGLFPQGRPSAAARPG